MGLENALRLSAFAAAAAFAAAPAFAQQAPLSPQAASHATKYMRSDAGPQNVENGRAAEPNTLTNAWYRRRRTYDYVPGHYYNYYPMAGGPAAGTATWCEQHYRTYDPATGMYRGYDGLYHRCG